MFEVDEEFFDGGGGELVHAEFFANVFVVEEVFGDGGALLFLFLLLAGSEEREAEEGEESEEGGDEEFTREGGDGQTVSRRDHVRVAGRWVRSERCIEKVL